MTAVKICGLTRERDVSLACELGASLLGFNFSGLSPRRIGMDAARRLSRVAGPEASKVGVFVRETREQILEAVEEASLDLVQIHRDVAEEEVDGLPVPILAVVRIANGSVPIPSAGVLKRCRALLFDTASARKTGGTGETFDWSVVANRTFPAPFFLAGGLRPENVAAAIRRARPAGVDVASGVESEPGIKDAGLLKRFFEEVHAADRRSDG